MRKIHYLLTLALCAGVGTVSATGCELIAAVDRTLISAGGGPGAGGAGGSTTSGGGGGQGGQGGQGTGGSDCGDMLQNGSETDVDCGGGCPPCALGQTCGVGTDCEIGNCADGRCCDMACEGVCQACNNAGAEGTCTYASIGSADPDCTPTTACDGAGACKTQNGEACAQLTDCLSGFCIDGVCCDAACSGACQACNLPLAEGTCTSVPSGGTDTGCMPPMACDGMGACKGELGAACATNTQCLSDFCADDVCCNSACSGTCEACDLAATNGTCTMVANGMDPDAECAMQAASTCGTNGSCNGVGACALYPAGTSCAAASCAAGVQTNADTCNGIGTCTDNGTTMCSPYICGIFTCKVSCVDSNDCAAGFTCTNSMCQ